MLVKEKNNNHFMIKTGNLAQKRKTFQKNSSNHVTLTRFDKKMSGIALPNQTNHIHDVYKMSAFNTASRMAILGSLYLPLVNTTRLQPCQG